MGGNGGRVQAATRNWGNRIPFIHKEAKQGPMGNEGTA